MADLASRYRLFVVRASGRTEIHATDVSLDPSKDKTRVYTTGVSQTARGMRSGKIQVSGELTFPVDVEGGKFEVPWHQMWRDNEKFALVGMRKGAVGQIDFEVLDCEVTSPGESHGAEDGESTLTVAFEALDYNGELP
jgi:hypothetical protein